MNVYLNLSDVSCSAFVGDAETHKTQGTQVWQDQHLFSSSWFTNTQVLTHLQVLLAALGTEAGLKRVNCKTQVGEIGKWCNMK